MILFVVKQATVIPIFYFENGERTIASWTLGFYEDLLKDKGFARIHHQHLINLSHLKKYVRGRGGMAIMHDGKEIQVSQRKKKTLSGS